MDVHDDSSSCGSTYDLHEHPHEYEAADERLQQSLYGSVISGFVVRKV